MQQTLAIIKPDAVRKNLIGEILRRLETDGLRVQNLKTLRLSTEQAEAFYREHADKPFFSELVEFMTSGPVVTAVVTGENAVARLRTLMGATDPAEAAPGTIRAEFAEEITENAIHGSDSTESARREVQFFFSESELVLS